MRRQTADTREKTACNGPIRSRIDVVGRYNKKSGEKCFGLNISESFVVYI